MRWRSDRAICWRKSLTTGFILLKSFDQNQIRLGYIQPRLFFLYFSTTTFKANFRLTIQQLWMLLLILTRIKWNEIWQLRVTVLLRGKLKRLLTENIRLHILLFKWHTTEMINISNRSSTNCKHIFVFFFFFCVSTTSTNYYAFIGFVFIFE